MSATSEGIEVNQEVVKEVGCIAQEDCYKAETGERDMPPLRQDEARGHSLV